MEPEEVRECLARAGLSQYRLGQLLDALGGGERSQSAVNRWATGRTRPLPAAVVLLRLLAEHPSMVPEVERLAQERTA
jgi:DNA-binding transcriptional regulator YiaG